MSFDIDAREFAEQEDFNAEWLPRADARYVTRLVGLEAVEKDAWAGWIATLAVEGVEVGKTHDCFDPVAVAGRQYKTIFKRIGHKFPQEKDRDMFALRQLVASAMGTEHTPDLKIGPLLAALTDEEADYSVTQPFTTIARCTAKLAKPTRKDGTPNPHAGEYFANLRTSFVL